MDGPMIDFRLAAVWLRRGRSSGPFPPPLSTVEARAYDLLLRHLTAAQRDEFTEVRYPLRWQGHCVSMPASRAFGLDALRTGGQDGHVNRYVRAWRGFTAIGHRSKIPYIIHVGSHANVLATDSHRPWFWLCSTLVHGEPMFDLMLAQKLAIEHDETTFLSTANAFI